MNFLNLIEIVNGYSEGFKIKKMPFFMVFMVFM